MVSQVVPLELLKAGERGCVCDVDGDPEVLHRLAEMGLQTGAIVEMLQPGSPCILAVNQHRLSLRCDETASILVVTPPEE